MTKHMISRKAICPYYKHEDRQVVYCEGVEDWNVIHMAFSDNRASLSYKNAYCRGCYARCRVYQMLEDLGGN